MDARVKYYRAINERYDLLLRLTNRPCTDRFIDEFRCEVEGILTVAIFDGIPTADFIKLRAYGSRLIVKSRDLPR